MSLKIDINEGPNRRGSCKIETEGSLLDLIAELTLVVVSIYQNTKRADPGLAEAFRTGLVDSLRDRMFGIWTPVARVTACVQLCQTLTSNNGPHGPGGPRR